MIVISLVVSTMHRASIPVVVVVGVAARDLDASSSSDFDPLLLSLIHVPALTTTAVSKQNSMATTYESPDPAGIFDLAQLVLDEVWGFPAFRGVQGQVRPPIPRSV
jgi:hypothetical protein